jgi:L-malate glycosyltransferase
VVRERLSGHVSFIGKVDKVPDYLRARDVFVFPCESVAFGVSLIEAMACGVPSMATSVGGIPDILEHDHNGLLFPAADDDALEEGLVRLLSDPALARRLAKAGRATVIRKFSIDCVARQHARMFADMLGPPHSPGA